MVYIMHMLTPGAETQETSTVTYAPYHELSESVRLIVSRRFLYASSCSSCVPLRFGEPSTPVHPHRRRRAQNAGEGEG